MLDLVLYYSDVNTKLSAVLARLAFTKTRPAPCRVNCVRRELTRTRKIRQLAHYVAKEPTSHSLARYRVSTAALARTATEPRAQFARNVKQEQKLLKRKLPFALNVVPVTTSPPNPSISAPSVRQVGLVFSRVLSVAPFVQPAISVRAQAVRHDHARRILFVQKVIKTSSNFSLSYLT